MKGRRLPTAIKQLQGTHQKCRDASDAPPINQMVVVNVPAWIDASARASEIYCELAGALTGMQVLSDEDRFSLALAASALEEVEKLTALIEDQGMFYDTTNAQGELMIRAHPAVKQRADAMRRAQSLLNDHGLTPAARSRVSAKTPTLKNVFDDLDD